MPEELLSRVFLLIVQDEARHTPDKRPQHPWTLASICARWRKICLEKPHLWSYISFFWTPGPLEAEKAKTSPHLLRIQLQLHRSGNTPLFIRAGKPSEWQSQVALWITVLSHSGRWEELEFGYRRGEEKEFGKLIGEGNGGFSRLRRISFDTGAPECASYSSPLPGHNASLTSLRSLTLKYVSDLHRLEDFPWAQLTHLSLEPFNGGFTSLLEVLLSCEKLTDLRLSLTEKHQNMICIDISSYFDEETVVLPNLRSLTFRRDPSLANILPFLQLPSLRYMNAGDIERDEDAPTLYSLLLDFLERYPSITKLDDAFEEQDKDGLVLEFDPLQFKNDDSSDGEDSNSESTEAEVN